MHNKSNEQRIPGYSNKQPGQTDSGSGNTSSVDREAVGRTPNGATTNKVSFLFDPDYYVDWGGRRVSRFSSTDKVIPFIIFILATINLMDYTQVYTTPFDNYELMSNSPVSIFSFYTIAFMCMYIGINSESPGKFKQLAITTFSMWLLSIVLLCVSIFFTINFFDISVDLYEFLPAVSGMLAFGLIGSSGIVYIFNTVDSIRRLRRLSKVIFLVSLFGIYQYIFGNTVVDSHVSKSMPLLPSIIFFLTSIFLYRTSKQVSALYHVDK